jgi:CRISPR-associated endonuclease/helicase Cas3
MTAEPDRLGGNAFAASFQRLTDHCPFPWQTDLYGRLCSGEVPEACVVPTGLGKTSVIAIWFLARLWNPGLPRRLVYVVNRRTVVDQTTDEVEKLRDRLPEIGVSLDDLAISTLRGQFADNREWSADPSRPAVVCGTVDMIGSRLLFGGYGIGYKGRPLHAPSSGRMPARSSRSGNCNRGIRHADCCVLGEFVEIYRSQRLTIGKYRNFTPARAV